MTYQIVSAQKLSATQLKDAMSMAESKLGVSGKPELVIDSTLIAGLKIVGAGQLIDLSLAKKLEDPKSFSAPVKPISIGEIISIGDGVAKVSGLDDAMMSELIEFPGGTQGLALSLHTTEVGVVLLGAYSHLKNGDKAVSTGRILSIPVGPNFLGRIVNPLGVAIDGMPDPVGAEIYPIERIASGVITRQHVSQPLQTGIVAIDAMIPVGRGQRELIIGDRGVGKSSIAITTIINQAKEGVKCIYVTIGQKRSFVAQLVNTLKEYGAMEYTTIVAATASDPASMQFLAPYAGAALGEYYAHHGQDALIIYDDLSKHAWAYREISLLLRRPSGREAYPGDVFYLHSRLLERACRLNKEYGGGSLTALPIIETQAGDVSAYIPTNVISITDGQIYLEADMFNSGYKPAVNVGLSVSRVGGDAQIKAMKKVAGRLRLDLAQYRELAAFSQFASDLDAKTKASLDKGARVSEILKQGWDEPYSVGVQVALIWAVTEGHANKITIKNMSEWKESFLSYLSSAAAGQKLVESIEKEGALSDDVLKQLLTVSQTVESSCAHLFVAESE